MKTNSVLQKNYIIFAYYFKPYLQNRSLVNYFLYGYMQLATFIHKKNYLICAYQYSNLIYKNVHYAITFYMDISQQLLHTKKNNTLNNVMLGKLVEPPWVVLNTKANYNSYKGEVMIFCL